MASNAHLSSVDGTCKKTFANWRGGGGGKGGGRGLPAEGVQALDRVGHLLPRGQTIADGMVRK